MRCPDDRDDRVVITGLGCVSALGTNKDDFWTALLEGRSGIRPMTEVYRAALPFLLVLLLVVLMVTYMPWIIVGVD